MKGNSMYVAGFNEEDITFDMLNNGKLGMTQGDNLITVEPAHINSIFGMFFRVLIEDMLNK